MSALNINMLFCIPDLLQENGGSRITFVSISDQFAQMKGQVHALSKKQKCAHYNYLVLNPNVTLHLTRSRLFHRWFWIVNYDSNFKKQIASLLRQLKIEIIVNHGLWDPFNHAVALVAESYRIPIVIFSHGMLQPASLAIKSWKKRAALFVYQRRDLLRAAAVVTSSMSEAEAVRKLGLNCPILCTSWGVSLPRLDSLHPREKEKHCALFLSRIHPIKGLLNLVAAWAAVRPKGWRIIIAGSDENRHRTKVERAVSKARLTDDFEFVGPVYGEIKDKLYREADLFILPSFGENFGLVIAEALSYGIPVITTRGTPWQSLLTNRCGWWIEIGTEPLAEAIKEAISLSDAERYRMGRLGRKLVENEFSWSKTAADINSLFAWILGRGPKPECLAD